MARNQLRIIAGEWRSRKLSFADVEGLRPTPDRVRETLFNWLAPVMAGARCLDPFAGSGALGLEALSRGAGEVMMLDLSPKVVKQLKENLQLLGCDRASVLQQDAVNYLKQPPEQPFDIVFLDPPYRKDLIRACIELLAKQNWLSEGARVYLEIESEAELPTLPDNWELTRSKKSGQVAYHLAIVGA
ncbi:MAG: 16S rRNA (guanine(966)-N(2))-methyltransferase RsmD [Gammaproteobacteria bacterium]|nr:16S rRNA (guanine(966)-N(2))-methyltransferase RsmD [Gammaproteobacteria bacterium]